MNKNLEKIDGWLNIFLQDGSEKLPLEPDRIARLRVLLETNSSLPGGCVSDSSPTLPDSGHLKTPSFPAVPTQLFRPHLDFLDNSKLNESSASIKIEDFSSDADSGHSSANSSNSELKKSPTQTTPVSPQFQRMMSLFPILANPFSDDRHAVPPRQTPKLHEIS